MKELEELHAILMMAVILEETHLQVVDAVEHVRVHVIQRVMTLVMTNAIRSVLISAMEVVAAAAVDVSVHV